jgi:hypothetical protein
MLHFIHGAFRALRLNPFLRTIAGLALASGVGMWVPWSGQPLVAWLFIILAIYLSIWLIRAVLFMDVRIRALVGPCFQLHVHTRIYPTYKWVDLYRAAEARGKADPHSSVIMAPMNLNHAIRIRLHDRSDMSDLRLLPAMTLARPISANDEALIPIEQGWCFPAQAHTGHRPVLIRVSYQANIDKVIVEVAAYSVEQAKKIVEELTDWASINSIYRNKSLRVTFDPTPPNRFGAQDADRGLNLTFLPDRPIEDAAIVLDDLMRDALEHTVVDFHRRRSQLMALGLPGKRGVLFYGPPGTGKTYTSAYLAHRLHDATKIVAAGKSLLRMADVCAIATAFQPSLVILEDVDLVFTDREMAPNTTLLGEFLDQLDGFASNDQVIFILTTNVLERVEAAIKDRPGRVSQCIYFGPPCHDLRRRYLVAQTTRFDISNVNLDRITQQTDGASQAFLRELVLRAVQIASIRDGNHNPVALFDEDFLQALREMTAAGGKMGKRIIGFQVE